MYSGSRQRPQGRSRGRSERSSPQRQQKRRFQDRGNATWKGPLLDYKEVELLRKFITTSSKVMSRKRAGTNACEQRALKRALKYARFLALLPYTGT